MMEQLVPPDGMMYQWVRMTLKGHEVADHINYRFSGWSYVPPERHPELESRGPVIWSGGSVLMEIPLKK